MAQACRGQLPELVDTAAHVLQSAHDTLCGPGTEGFQPILVDPQLTAAHAEVESIKTQLQVCVGVDVWVYRALVSTYTATTRWDFLMDSVCALCARQYVCALPGWSVCLSTYAVCVCVCVCCVLQNTCNDIVNASNAVLSYGQAHQERINTERSVLYLFYTDPEKLNVSLFAHSYTMHANVLSSCNVSVLTVQLRVRIPCMQVMLMPATETPCNSSAGQQCPCV